MKQKLAKHAAQSTPAPSKYSNKDRKQKLKSILKDLKAEKHIQNRTLKTWLTEDEYAELDSAWADQKDIREQLKDKPDAVKEYEKLLKKGLFAEAKADRYVSKNSKTALKLRYESQALFERALEYLDEQLQADPSLEQWFDRRLDFSAGGNLSISGAGMPRAVTSIFTLTAIFCSAIFVIPN
jgi:tetratricopeptide (TPR) repeat protein